MSRAGSPAGGPQSRKERVSIAKDAAMAFMDADVDGDQTLSFEEFHLMASASCPLSESDFRDLFDGCDIDGNGVLTMNEFFFWTLSMTTMKSGTGLESLFRKYDTSGEGQLDAAEFGRALEELGFGDHAHKIFMELDEDMTGTVSFSELEDKLKQSACMSAGSSVSRQCRRFLSTLIYHDGGGGAAAGQTHGNDGKPAPSGSPAKLDIAELNRGWKLVAHDMESLRVELGNILLRNKMRVSDLYAMISLEEKQKGIKGKRPKHSIPLPRFHVIMEKLGYEGPASMLDEVFDELDGDKSGTLELEELWAWMNGTHTRRHRALTLTLLSERGDEDSTTLFTIEWEPIELHRQVQLMLICNDLAPLDLLKGFDRSTSDGDGDDKLQFKEFLRMMKRLIKPATPEEVDLWDDVIRPCVQRSFYQIAGADREIDVIEFEKWLNKGWRLAEKRRERELAGLDADDMEEEEEDRRPAFLRRAAPAPAPAPASASAPAPAPARWQISHRAPAPAPAPAAAVPHRPHSRAPPGARRGQSAVFAKTEARLRGNALGFELTDYLSKLAKISQGHRHPREQEALLNRAHGDLKQRQQRKARAATQLDDDALSLTTDSSDPFGFALAEWGYEATWDYKRRDVAQR